MTQAPLPAPRAGSAAHLEVRQSRPVVVVDVSDWLDLATAPQVRVVVDAGLRRASDRLEIDLTRCPLADLQGIQMLEQAQRRATLQGTEIVLTGVGPRLRRVLHLVGLDRALSVEPELRQVTA